MEPFESVRSGVVLGHGRGEPAALPLGPPRFAPSRDVLRPTRHRRAVPIAPLDHDVWFDELAPVEAIGE